MQFFGNSNNIPGWLEIFAALIIISPSAVVPAEHCSLFHIQVLNAIFHPSPLPPPTYPRFPAFLTLFPHLSNLLTLNSFWNTRSINRNNNRIISKNSKSVLSNNAPLGLRFHPPRTPTPTTSVVRGVITEI